MKAYFVYTSGEVNDPIDLMDAIDAGMYSDTAARAQELANDESAAQKRVVKVYKLSCEEVS